MNTSKQEGVIANLLLASIIHNGNYYVILHKYFYACNKGSLLDNFVILQIETLLDLWSAQGTFQRNLLQKLGSLCIEKERERKYMNV